MADTLKQKEQELKALEDRLRSLQEHASRVNMNNALSINTGNSEANISNLDRAIKMTTDDIQKLKTELASLQGTNHILNVNGDDIKEFKAILNEFGDIKKISIDFNGFKELANLFEKLRNMPSIHDFLSDNNQKLFESQVDAKRNAEASFAGFGLGKFIFDAKNYKVDEKVLDAVVSKNKETIMQSIKNMFEFNLANIKLAETGNIADYNNAVSKSSKVYNKQDNNNTLYNKLNADVVQERFNTKVDTSEAKDLGATNLEQMSKVLNKTKDELNAYTNVFNNAAQSVIGDTEAMGISAVDLKEQLNKLLSDAQGLSNLGKNINLNDQGQVDDFVTKIKELDKTFSDLSTVILANLKEMNTAFQREFKLDDGTTGYLKQQLNELRDLFSDDFLKIDVTKFAPDLSNWADKFVEQVNRIEYQMGRITEFGKQRNETEKALGFVVERKDVNPIQEAKRAELAEYDQIAKDYGFSGVGDTSFLSSSPDIAQEIDSINIYIKQLDDAVGKRIKGYIEIFNEAENLLKSGQSNKSLYETVGDQVTRSLYGDNIDWNSVTPSKLKDMERGLDGDDEFFGTKTADSIAKVEEASTKATASVRNYASELDNLVATDKTLSSEQKQGILGQDFSNRVKKYAEDVAYFKNELQGLGSTTLTNMPGVQLDPNKTEDFTSLTNYKNRVNEAVDSLAVLKEQQASLFSNLSDPSTMMKMNTSGISKDLFAEIKQTLESGYKVNLLEGSADKEKLDKLRAGFEQLVSDFKAYNIDIVSDNEIQNLAKLEAMQNAINSESRRQVEQASAQARYESDKVKYLGQYNRLAQAQANIKALENTKSSLISGASKTDKTAISERYNKEILSNQSIVRSAQQAIEKYKSEFTKHKLEIPITPVVKATPNLSEQFNKEFMRFKATGRNEILGGLRGQDATVAKLNNEAQALGLNVDKINARLNAMSNTIKTAFYSGDIDKARSLMGAYGAEVDKLNNKISGQAKAQDIAKQRQAEAAREADRLAKAQSKAAEEAKKAAEKEKQAYQDSLNAAKQKVTQGLSAIKSFAEGVNSAVNKVVNIIRTGIRLVNKVISTVGNIISTLGHGVKSIISIFGNLGNRVRGTAGNSGKLNGSFNILAGTATELRSKIMLLKGAFDTLFNNSMIAGATKLMSSVMSLNIIIGDDLTKSTIEWANNMQDAFGIDARGLISDLQEVTGVLKGLGMNSQDISVMGPNLLSISRYLAMMGLAGGDAGMAMSKITSGLKGMTQAIDDLGLSVRESEMDDFLNKLKQQGNEFANIGTKYASLNEEARIYVRSASILQQFLTNFGTFNSDLSEYVFNVDAFTRTLNSVTGRISILKQTWSGFLSTIGAGLMKVAAVVAGYIIPVLRMATAAVERFFAWLSALTGINFNVSLGSDLNSLENIEDSSGGVKETTDEVSDLNDELEKVDENAKKAKGSLQSFDRVNNVTSSSGSNSESNKDAFDYAKVLGGFKKLLDPLDEEYDKFLDSLNEKNEKWWNQFKNWVIRKCKEITGRIDFDLGFDWDKIKKNLDTTWKNIKKLIKSWGTFFVEIELKIADDVNIGAIVTKFTELISKISELATAFSNVAIPVFRELYDEYLKPVFEFIGNKAIEYLDKAINKIKEWIKYWSETPDEAGANLKQSLEDLWSVAKGEKDAEGPLQNLVAVLREVKDIAVELAPVIKELVTQFGAWASEELLPWLVEKLGEIKDWLAENKDKVEDLLTTVAGMVWDGFKTFVDLVGKLVDFCVQNPDAVTTFFGGLLALKVGSWFTSTAASIGLATMGMSNFTGLFAEGGALASIGSTLGTTLAGVSATTLGIAAAVIAAIALVVAAIVDLWNTSETFRSGIASILEGIKTTFESDFDKVKESFNQLKEKFSELYNAYSDSGLKTLLEVVILSVISNIILYIQNLITIVMGVVSIVIDVVTRIIGIILNLADMISGTFDVIMGIITGDWDRVKSGWDTGLNGLIGLVKNLVGTIGDLFSGLWDTVKGIWDNIVGAGENIASSIEETISNRWDSMTGKTRASSARKVTASTNANGGSIAGGQFFVANENGQAELIGNIDGSGRTNVANNGMIIEAMTNGVFTGVYNALAEVNNQRGTVAGAGQNVNLRIDGFGLIDSSVLSELARMLAPYQNSNNANIANVNFSI